jgi:hypothetical protein
MLEDARQREKDLEASLAAKQAQLSASRHEAEARQYTTELATLQAQILALRQVGLKICVAAAGVAGSAAHGGARSCSHPASMLPADMLPAAMCFTMLLILWLFPYLPVAS